MSSVGPKLLIPRLSLRVHGLHGKSQAAQGFNVLVSYKGLNLMTYLHGVELFAVIRFCKLTRDRLITEVDYHNTPIGCRISGSQCISTIPPKA